MESGEIVSDSKLDGAEAAVGVYLSSAAAATVRAAPLVAALRGELELLLLAR